MSKLVKYSLLSFPVASFGLGVWQLKRLEWKKGLIAKLEEQLSGEPLDLSCLDSTENYDAFEYKRFKVRGHFDRDPNHQLYIKPRQLIVNDEALARGRTSLQSNIGVNVINPFIVAGEKNMKILINRGWLATKGKIDTVESSAHLGFGPEESDIEVVGILRVNDNRPRYGMFVDETAKQWPIRDLDAMARVLRTSKIFLDADASLSPGQGPIGGQTSLTIRNEHLNYAITWFGLAILSYLMWYSRYGRRKLAYAKTRW